MRSFRILLLLGALLGVLTVALRADPQVVPGTLQSPVTTPEAPPETVVVHRSPRAVMAAFLKGMTRYYNLKTYEDQDLDLALSCFHEVDLVHSREELQELAVQLHNALLRMTWVELSSIGMPGSADDSSTGTPESPDDVEGTFTWNIPQVNEFAIGGEEPKSPGKIVFVRIREATALQSANWRFAPSLLEDIPIWYELWKDEPIRAEYLKAIKKASGDLSARERLGFEVLEHVPSVLRRRHFLLESWQWIGVALLACLGVLLGRIVSFFLRHLSQRAAKSERLVLEKRVLVGFERPFSLFVMAWIILLMLPAIRLEPRYFSILRLALALFLSVTGVWSTFRLVDVGASWLSSIASRTHNRFDDILVPLLRRMAKIFLTFVGIVYAASYLSNDLYGIVAGLSIGSLAVGFAAKDSIENLFGTVTVLLDKPFQLGDWITVGEVDGNVEEVGFRSTKVRTFYNSLITVPNSLFISAKIDNWGARRYRRIKTMVGLAYDTPPLKIESFCEALRELVRTHPYTRKDYYHIYLNAFGASSLDVLVYCFVETPDWSTELREKHRLYLDILRVADGLGIEIAFPTQTLHVHQGGEATSGPEMKDGPRSAERMGRELANLIVKEGMAEYEGQKPPPVVID